MPTVQLQRLAVSPSRVKQVLKPVLKLFVEFSHLTTCHGFRQITAPNRRIPLRLLWTGVIIGLFFGLGKELYDKFHEYSNHEVTTDIHDEVVPGMEFPAITICSINRFQKEEDELAYAKINLLAESASVHENMDHDHHKWMAATMKSFREQVSNIGVTKYFIKDQMLTKGWLLNDAMLRHCTFEKEKCTLSQNFTQIVTPMGVCYSYDPDVKPIQKVAGSGHGLEMYIGINQFDYVSQGTSGLKPGIKVIIHEHNTLPKVLGFGPSASSGHTGYITLMKTEKHLMYEPWGQCKLELKKLKHHEEYSVAACMEECKVQFIIDTCNCKPYWDNLFIETECDAHSILMCSGAAEKRFPLTQTTDTCNCGLPCDFGVYEAKDTSIFPGIEVAKFLSTSSYRNDSIVDLQEIEESFDKLRLYGKDHVMLDIFYDKLSYTSISQRKSISEISLMSDIGGLLGLWLGISLITLGEFVQFLVDALEHWIEVNRGNRIKKGKHTHISQVDPKMLEEYANIWDESEEEDESTNFKSVMQYGKKPI